MIIFAMRIIPMLSLLLCVACAQPTKQTQPADSEASGSQSAPKKKVEKIAQLSLEEIGEAKKQYLVPSPGEILSSLDKLDRVAWSRLASYDTKADYDDKYARALNLGVRVADAFMAVNARDASKFGEMSTIVFDLAREIGLGDVLEGRRGDLDNLAADGRWEELKAALDNVQNDVRQEVKAMGESELVVLASAGGWMEGLRVVSAHLKDHHTDENAELLKQARLIEYFRSEISQMPAEVQQHPLVMATVQTLSTLAPLVGTEAGVGLNETKQIYQVTDRLVATLEAGR
jgi:hypothetical protein